MKILGIETSCDETSASIVETRKGRKFGKVLSEVTVSQIKKHQKFGGVVPELASREHSNNIDFIVKKTLKNSKEEDFKQTYYLESKILCLPVHKNISEKDIKKIS